MSLPEVKLAPNLAPPIAGGLVLALSLWGFFNPERIPWPASIFLSLLGLLLIFQLKRITINSAEISIRSILTGKTKRVAKAEINAILSGSISTTASEIGAFKKGKILTIRTNAKQTINISTSNISQADFQKLMQFLQKHYSEKLH